MKKTILLIGILASFYCVQAQSINIIEDFETNSLGWTEVVDKRGESVIIEGVMKVRSKDETGFYESHCFTDIDPKADFEIKCDVKVKVINDKSNFGVMFNYTDNGNFMVFMVEKGNAVLRKYKDRRLVGSISNNIKLKKARNSNVEISIKYQTGRVLCEVNGMHAIEARNIELTSGGIGVYVMGKQKLEFDNLKLIQ